MATAKLEDVSVGSAKMDLKGLMGGPGAILGLPGGLLEEGRPHGVGRAPVRTAAWDLGALKPWQMAAADLGTDLMGTTGDDGD